MKATELIVLHDPESETSLAIVFFETKDDYELGDEILSTMPVGDTPGQRTSVKRYDVSHRMTACDGDALNALARAARSRHPRKGVLVYARRRRRPPTRLPAGC